MTENAIFCEVDVQNDFVAGSLQVAQVLDNGGQRLSNMLELSEHAGMLIGSVDSHDFRAWEFKSNDNVGPNGEDPQFPDHCVVGTWGWLRVQRDVRKDVVFIPDAELGDTQLAKRMMGSSSIFFMKEVYSLFANPNAEKALREITKTRDTNTVVLYGIATDYCVKAAIEGLEAFGMKVIVVEDAIAAVDKDMGKVLVEKWRAQGIELIDTRTALRRFCGVNP